MRSKLSVVGLVLLSAGCLGSEVNGPEGAECVRLAQCEPGLACVNGTCSGDLTALAEAGIVPILDAGVLTDTAVVGDEGN